MTTVSIIIPVYNVERYVEKCILSVLNQTYKKIELIIVNDGSTDNSENIIKNIIKNKQNVKLVNQENMGLSEARNTGINIANGEYIFLLDSDDYIECDVISTLINRAEKDNLDIVIGKYNVIYENNKKVKSSTEFLDENKILNNIESIEELFVSGKFHFHAWGKLYRRTLFNNIKYPKGRYYEDIATTYKLFFYAKRISFVNISTCEYLMRDSSICHSSFQEKHLDFIKNIDEMEDFLKRNKIYSQLENPFKIMKLRNYLYLGFIKVAEASVYNKKEILSLLKDKTYDELIDNNLRISKRENIYRRLVLFNMNMFIFFVNIEEMVKKLILG